MYQPTRMGEAAAPRLLSVKAPKTDRTPFKVCDSGRTAPSCGAEDSLLDQRLHKAQPQRQMKGGVEAALVVVESHKIYLFQWAL